MTPLTAIFPLMIVAGAVLIIYGMKQRAGSKAKSPQPEDLFLDFTEARPREETLIDLERDDTILRRREKAPFQSESHQPEALDVTGRAEGSPRGDAR